MEETKRQRQVGKLLHEELSDIFLRIGFNIVEGGMVSISKVSVTPDLMEARVYVSLFQVGDDKQMLQEIRERTKEIRGLLGDRVRNQLRRIPELSFFVDDTLDHVFKMEALFAKIKEEDDKLKENLQQKKGED